MSWLQDQGRTIQVRIGCCGGLILAWLVCAVIAVLAGGGQWNQTTALGNVATPTIQATATTVQSAATTGQAKSEAVAPATKDTATRPAAGAPVERAAVKVGETVRAGTWEYTVTQVKRTKDPLVWTQFGNSTQAKGEWLIIDLDLKNVDKESSPVNTHDFEVQDAGGVKYSHSADFGAYSAFPDYHKLSKLGQQFPPNVSVRTVLVFDISPDAKGLKLHLKQARTMVDLEQKA